MDAASLEEANKLRVSLGMKPLPVPGAAEPEPGSDNEASAEESDYLQARTDAAGENFQKLRAEEDVKRRRDERAAAIKKAREKAQRHAVLEGKGLGDGEEEVDAKAWLAGQKKRQKQIAKLRKLEEEQAAAEAQAAAALQYTSRDLAGVKVAHDASNFLDGEEQILTLKDSTIAENEEEGDELENLGLREQERLQRNLDLKKKKTDYNPLAGDLDTKNLLSKYDEEIYGVEKKRFTLDANGISDLADILDSAPNKAKAQGIDLDILDENVGPSSDYLDISDIKVKKPKKKKSKSTRQKASDPDDFLLPEQPAQGDEKMDVDTSAPATNKRKQSEDANLVDDDDLQFALSMQRRNALKKRKRIRPEDIAKQLKEEAPEEADGGPEETGGMVIGEVSEFVANIKKPDEEERPKKRRATTEPRVEEDGEGEDVTMEGAEVYSRTQEDDEEQVQEEEETPEDRDDVMEEKTVGQSIGATLSLLRDRGVLRESEGGAERHETFIKKQEFLAKKRRMEAELEESARQQRERDRASGRLERMGQREQQEWARQQNNQRELQASRRLAELFNAEFQPTFEIKHTDEDGRRLDTKEAFKHLSHQFHGKGSGKGKTDKKIKKIADEQRREAQSVLDAGRDVGMSSVTAQQLKKRREAGVRLA
ncbi:related to DNA binding protein SART-1 [Cephalotrichum gorgonifer]|uniref:Related to DNA binding protein SART-1 n=1 Tax=Cephalotrichum gorgonifer TaxID=2041049 RepID=A0AAE8N698_9PEZI|nr:related to DNA binding protein SART-1 [Cephalotrichum gorgonifer]